MHKITIYLILSTFIFFHGCQKRNQIATDDVSKREGIAFSVSQAMSWFQLNNNQTAERANSIWFRDIAPNWAKASVGEDQIWYVVEVPVRFDKDPGFVIRNPLANRENQAIDSRTILLILKNKQSGKNIPS